MSGKGKEKVSDKGKRKWTAENDNEKTRGSKRKNRNVLQFFDDVAYQVDEDDDDVDDFSDSDLDGFEDEDFFSEINAKDAPKKVPEAPFVPKEEVMSEEEFDRIMEERYKPGSGFVKFAEEDGGYEDKRSVDGSSIYAPSAKDQPKIWKVKCTAGRERCTAFCLMQKYVDREFLGSKMPIVSAFSPDQLKGFILIEADKQGDIYEASKGITSIYPTRVTPIPSKEFSRMLCVRSKSSGISEGMWARVKNGKYKGDLASVVAVNDAKKKVTVKLIPRIDLKALAEKFGGGVAPKRAAIPPQRLISSSELDEFRPLIHSRRDRDTNEMVEVLDGMMLKDGYMYKKVSVDSLIIWGVVPTDDELLKFEPSKKDDSTNVQWLSQLFGEYKKEHAETVMKQDKGSGKSEGSTSATKGSNSESHDLVFFGRKDFGVVLGQEKDDCVKVLTEGSDGQSVVTVKRSDLKSASFDKKLFFALDQNSHSVSISDIVRVLSGPLKERQGTVKKIYKGVLFLWDESEHENSGYLCVKAKSCEKVNLSGKESHGKDNGPGPSGFADYSSSPKSPLSPDNSFQEKSNKITFQQREDDGMFSVGQSLRIRVGPLKGYLCRALAIRRSDVTVKLDSQQKILTVKAEHLSEVRGRNASISQGEESGSIKPFDFLGTQNGASDWTAGAPSSTEGNGWNAGGSTERSSWTNFDSSNSLVSKEPGSADPVGDNANKGTENSSWQIKASTESSPWGVAEAKQVTNQGTSGWGTSNSGWNQSTSSKAVDGESDSWGKAAAVDTHVVKDNSWGAAAAEKQAGGAWNASGDGAAAASGSQWGKSVDVKKDDDNAKSWGKVDASSKSWDNTQMAIDAAPKENHRNDGWNKVNPVGAADSEPSWNKKNDKSGWGKVEGSSAGSKQDVGTSWSKPTEKSLDAQQSDFNKGSNRSDDWVSLAKSAGDDTSGGGWNVSKGSADKNIKYTGWGGASTGNEGSGNGGGGSWDNKVIKLNGGGGSWGSSAKSDGDNTAGGGWNVSKDSADKNIKSSGWSGASMGNEGSGNGGGGSWDNKVIKPNGGGGSWGSSAKSDGDNTAGGWNVSKDSSDKNIKSSGWGGASMGNEGSGNGGGDSWDCKVIKPNDSTNSSWKANGNNQSSSDWSAKGDWGSVSEKKSPGGGDGAWKNVDGESSTGWGKSNWGKSGASGDGNQESGWSRRGNQSFGDSSNQDNYSGDRGRGGRWSGGRGDRGGFRGRGRFDFNGNQDDSFSGRGRGSRWGEGRSGRGGYDQEGGGFRGRGGGGFRGRGRGDFSYEDKSEGWKNSNENSEGWKSGGGNSEGWKNSGGGGGWNQTANDNNQQKREATTGGGWNTNNNGRSNVSPKKAQPGSWGSAPAASGNSSGNWDMLDKNDEGPSGSWGKGAPSSWGAGSGKW